MQKWRFFAAAFAIFSIGCTEDTLTTSSARIVEAGWSFGFCLGPCRGELDIEGEALALRVTDRTGSQVLALNRGRLTSSASARLVGLGASLPADLLETYGCPDCADGGASWLTVARDSSSRRSEYEYGNPPAELTSADELLTSVMEALRDCRETSEVTLEAGCAPI